MRRPFGASGKVDVGKGIEFVENDVYVVASDACGQHGDAFSAAGACDAVKLAVACVVLPGVEMCSHGVDTRRIANEDDAVSQLVGSHVQVEDC